MDEKIFVGAWVTTLSRTMGYFSGVAHISADHNVIGTIDDALGSAEISGKWADDKLEFVKRYSEGAHPLVGRDSSGVPLPINYEGRRDGERYEGTYSINGIKDTLHSGSFFLKCVEGPTVTEDQIRSLLEEIAAKVRENDSHN